MTGPQIRDLRISLSLSQAAFAGRLGVTPNTVARWERGEVKPGQAMRWRLELLETGVCPLCGDWHNR